MYGSNAETSVNDLDGQPLQRDVQIVGEIVGNEPTMLISTSDSQ